MSEFSSKSGLTTNGHAEPGSELEEAIFRDLSYRIEYFHCCFVPVKETTDSLLFFHPEILKDEEGAPYLAVYPTEKDMNAAGITNAQRVLWGAVFTYVLQYNVADRIIIFNSQNACAIRKPVLWKIFEDAGEEEFYDIDLFIKNAWIYVLKHSRIVKDRKPMMDYSVPIAEAAGRRGVSLRNLTVMLTGILSELVTDPDTDFQEIRMMFGHKVADTLLEVRKLKHIMENPDYERMLSDWYGNAGKNSRILALYMLYAYQRRLNRLTTVSEDGEQLLDGIRIEILATQLSKMQDLFYEMQFNNDCSDIYWNIVGSFKDLFVTYYYDEHSECFYMKCVDGKIPHFIEKELPKWKECEYGIPRTAKPVMRGFAERTIDNWEELFEETNRAESVKFEDYIASVRKHISKREEELTEDAVDSLINSNMAFISGQYEDHIELLDSGLIDKNAFLSESSGATADYLIRKNPYTVDYYLLRSGDSSDEEYLIKVINGDNRYLYTNGDWTSTDRGIWKLSCEMDNAWKITKKEALAYIEKYF